MGRRVIINKIKVITMLMMKPRDLLKVALIYLRDEIKRRIVDGETTEPTGMVVEFMPLGASWTDICERK